MKCFTCSHYNGATEPGTGECKANHTRTFATTECFQPWLYKKKTLIIKENKNNGQTNN